MQLNQLAGKKGSAVKFKRIGRGIGSDKGKTCGRGTKGQKARTGVALNGFAGGQMPIYRRHGKIGFNNKIFKKFFSVINLGCLQQAIDEKKISEKGITLEKLVEANVLKITHQHNAGLKVLASGEIKSAIDITVEAISETAKSMIEKAGGKVSIKECKKNTDETGRFAKKETKSAGRPKKSSKKED